MKKTSKIQIMTLLIAMASLLSPQQSMARLINDMQTCQGLIDFVQLKMTESHKKYSAKDIKIVSKGLDAYNDYIQKTIVNPGLLKAARGNQKKADLMQQQVNTYKKRVTKSYQKRFVAKELFIDFVRDLNDCTQKSVPKGRDLNALKTSFSKIVELMKN